MSGLTQQSSSKVVTQIYGMVKPKIGNNLVSMFILWYINNKCALSFLSFARYTFVLDAYTKRYFRKSECDLMWVEINFQISPLWWRHSPRKVQVSVHPGHTWNERERRIGMNSLWKSGRWVGHILIRALLLFTYTGNWHCTALHINIFAIINYLRYY